jgi:phosphoribosylformimino-5-aminoimidazole carboxamide ribotide isomerase
MTPFTIFPAIDLRGGRVVRLRQGDPDRETEYATDPVAVARRWAESGADWLHVVNLDGAFGERSRASENSGSPDLRNFEALSRVLEVGPRVQFGGGLRDLDAMRQALALGVARVVLGTVAVEQPALLAAALDEFGAERVAVGIDAREGIVQIRGWQEAAPIRARDLARRWAEMGGRWLIFTDISRDGMSSGVNVEATAALARATGLRVIASGGVASLDDVQRVREAGLSGVIIGRALYEGRIDLAEVYQQMDTENVC